MLNFFTKKDFLVNHLEGFVDIHNHILPGIDDGAKTVQDSIALLRGFSEFGVANFVCTPHVMQSYYPNTPKTINKAYEQLKEELKLQEIVNVKIDFSAEYLIDEGFEAKLDDDQILPLNEQYLLVEMSFVQAPLNFENAIEKIISKKMYPILAHPERYNFIGRKLGNYQRYVQMGLKLQVNLLSVAGYYGKDVQKTAFYLLENNLVDFVASDVHKINQIKFLKEFTLPKKKLNILRPIILRTIQSF